MIPIAIQFYLPTTLPRNPSVAWHKGGWEEPYPHSLSHFPLAHAPNLLVTRPSRWVTIGALELKLKFEISLTVVDGKGKMGSNMPAGVELAGGQRPLTGMFCSSLQGRNPWVDVRLGSKDKVFLMVIAPFVTTPPHKMAEHLQVNQKWVISSAASFLQTTENGESQQQVGSLSHSHCFFACR